MELCSLIVLAAIGTYIWFAVRRRSVDAGTF
jgi:hypothetical protein